MCQKNPETEIWKKYQKPKNPPPTRPLLSELTQNLLSIQNCAPFKNYVSDNLGPILQPKNNNTEWSLND